MRVTNGLPQALDLSLECRACKGYGLMPYPPHRFQRGRIGGQTGNDVPMDMRNLVAEEFVIDLAGFIGPRKDLGDESDFFYQLDPLCPGQVKQFRRVALKDQNRPAGEKLIVVEKDPRKPQIDDKVVGTGPDPRAGKTRGIAHG